MYLIVEARFEQLRRGKRVGKEGSVDIYNVSGSVALLRCRTVVVL